MTNTFLYIRHQLNSPAASISEAHASGHR